MMNETQLGHRIDRLHGEQERQLDSFLSQPSIVACVVTPVVVSPQLLTRMDAQRVYHFAGRVPASGQGEKRTSMLLQESMIRLCPGMGSSFVILCEEALKNAQGLYASPSMLGGHSNDPGRGLDVQFELNPSETRELAEYMRWLGSVRPAFDLLHDREVGARSVAVQSMPKFRRLAGFSSWDELSRHAAETMSQVAKSIWVTTSTSKKTGFMEQVGEIASEKKLSVRCMIADQASARDLADAYPSWEVLHCPPMAANSILLDANDDPVAFTCSVNWMGASMEKTMGVALPLRIDDVRIKQVRQLWDEVAPFCKRIEAK